MAYEIMQVSPLPPAMLKDLQEQGFVLHDHSHILDPAALARVRALVGDGKTAKVDKKLLQMLPNVKLIAIVGDSYAGIDLDVVLQKDITVTYTPSQSPADLADLAFALMLNLGRRVLQADRFVRNNDWVEEPFALAPRFSGARVGLLGWGEANRAVARRADGFDMQVFYCAAQPLPETPYTFCRTAVELATQVDYLVTTPAIGKAPTSSPRVSAEVLQALGPKGYWVHLGPAETVEPAVLIKALQDKQIAGAALDAFWDEPRVPAELRALSQVILTPHIAGATQASRIGMAQLAIDNLLAFFEHRALLTPIPECQPL